MTNPEERILDWQSEHDPKSRSFPIRALLPESIKPVRKMWKQGVVLDQGSEGACVGFGWTATLLAEPFAPQKQPTIASAQTAALSYYKRAQVIDEWEGENYSGTSVLAGAKIMQAEGYVGEYRWCFGIEDLRDAVLTKGPVVLGVPWYQGMYHTRKSGLVEVTGDKVGGHCIVVTGYHPAKAIEGRQLEVFRWRNSWGRDYGLNGSAFIAYSDLSNLLKDGGEACIPTEIKVPSFL